MERGGYRMTTTGDESQAVEQAGGENLTKAEGEMKIAPKVIPHPSIEERAHRGREARKKVTRASHGGWAPAGDRPDPVALLVEQDARREADLVPVRHGRMMVSPFTFYRGAARIMAHDLAVSAPSGLTVQLCGDAHLSNFGLFASPERTLVFDLNDFDETLPGPFEWDVKRMAASFTIAGRNNAFKRKDVVAATTASVETYRTSMAAFADMRTLDVWYSYLSVEDILDQLGSGTVRKNAQKIADKARMRDSIQALSKLAAVQDGQYRIVSQPPIVVPLRELAGQMDPVEVANGVHGMFREYRASLQPDRRLLLERFEVVDIARKVVGVGSVGTRSFIVLGQGRDGGDPFFLQVKEATRSVLEDRLPKSRYRNHGERVVQGQRLMQAASDIFLGWSKGADTSRHFYWRQLRDMKGSIDVERARPDGFLSYARACGWTLARAHARTGDPIAISAYLGKSDAFDRAIMEFSDIYADQNELDHAAFLKAIDEGRIEAIEGI